LPVARIRVRNVYSRIDTNVSRLFHGKNAHHGHELFEPAPARSELASGAEVVFALVAEMRLELQPANKAVAWRINGVRDKDVSWPQHVLPFAEPVTLGEELLARLFERSPPWELL
jgi:hypothetical protein